MAFNTGNLVVYVTGGDMLFSVQSINSRSIKDKLGIRAYLYFPYMYITENESAIEQRAYYTDLTIKNTPCYANVDVAQVQNFSEIVNGKPVVKRAFTVGALFEIKAAIGNAKAIIMTAKVGYADERTEEQKAAQGHHSAEEVIAERYPDLYVSTEAVKPYAYTSLYANGVPEAGLHIEAAMYGRSRERVLFNYIVENISADLINVDSNVYPYSDGYLSKTAFEEGLGEYENALTTLRDYIDSFVFGWQKAYKNFTVALGGSETGNTFTWLSEYRETITNDYLLDENTFPTGLRNYPVYNYDGSAVNVHNYADTLIPAFAKPGMRVFPVVKRKTVTYTASGNKKSVPVFIVFMMYGLETASVDKVGKQQDFCCFYHVCRVAMHVPSEDGSSHFKYCKELVLGDDTVFCPVEPVVGNVELGVDGNDRIAVSLMFTTATIKQTVQAETYLDLEGFIKVADVQMWSTDLVPSTMSVGDGTGVSFNFVKSYRIFTGRSNMDNAPQSYTNVDGMLNANLTVNNDIGYGISGIDMRDTNDNRWETYFADIYLPDFDARNEATLVLRTVRYKRRFKPFVTVTSVNGVLILIPTGQLRYADAYDTNNLPIYEVSEGQVPTDDEGAYYENMRLMNTGHYIPNGEDDNHHDNPAAKIASHGVFDGGHYVFYILCLSLSYPAYDETISVSISIGTRDRNIRLEGTVQSMLPFMQIYSNNWDQVVDIRVIDLQFVGENSIQVTYSIELAKEHNGGTYEVYIDVPVVYNKTSSNSNGNTDVWSYTVTHVTQNNTRCGGNRYGIYVYEYDKYDEGTDTLTIEGNHVVEPYNVSSITIGDSYGTNDTSYVSVPNKGRNFGLVGARCVCVKRGDYKYVIPTCV